MNPAEAAGAVSSAQGRVMDDEFVACPGCVWSIKMLLSVLNSRGKKMAKTEEPGMCLTSMFFFSGLPFIAKAIW